MDETEGLSFSRWTQSGGSSSSYRNGTESSAELEELPWLRMLQEDNNKTLQQQEDS